MKTNATIAFAYLWATLLLAMNFSDARAQTQTPRYQSINSNSNGFYEALPQGYDSETGTYPLIIFLHGVGELGDGSPAQLPTVLRNGPPKLIDNGTFPASFTVNGEQFKFIVISPQFLAWPIADGIQAVIDFAVSHYRVNTKRIYVTGLSMGGGVTWDYGSYNALYANRVAAIAPVCGASGPTPEKVSVIVSAHLAVWAFHNQDDPTVPVTNTISYVDDINASSPAIPARKTIFPVSGHDAWTKAYDPAYKENNMNVYEWMLQYQRGNTPPANQLPASNAGNDITLTLPNNSVTLAGSGTDNDGSISSYSWTKISGPAQYSINNSNIANPVISNLAEGSYTLRLTVTDNSGATASDDMIITENAISNNYAPIPGKIEAENYSAMYGVQTENTSDAGGGKDIGWVQTGDWLNYNVNVASAGNYTINFRIACPNQGQQLQLQNSGGTILATVPIPQTGDYQYWTTTTATVSLQAGNQTLRIYSSAGSWNLNWIEFISASQNPTGAIIPGKIEAENYGAMSGIGTENTADEGGGKNVGWIDTGDWIDYFTNVTTAGSYTVNIRVSALFAGQQLQIINSSGSVLTTLDVPQTGNYQIWTTAVTTVTLPAGNQTLRIYSAKGSFNINWMEFSSAMHTIGVATPGKIEAENYDDMSGVLTETTTDIGGGKNVGWLDTGDWLEYHTNISSADNYTVNLRLASNYSRSQLQLRNSSGTILATVDVPNTRGYQNWTTVSTTIPIEAGNQAIRIYSSNGSWNLNWLEIVSSTTATNANIRLTGASAAITPEVNINTGKQSFAIYPNPVRDNFSLQLNNGHMGTMNLQLSDQSGKIIKTLKYEKTQLMYLLNIKTDDVAPGMYYLKVRIGKWSESRKLIKI